MIKTAGGTATNLVKRTWGDFPDNSGDWTIFLRIKYPSTPSGSTYTSLFNLFDGAADFSNPYLHIGSDVDSGNVGIDVFVDGSHEFQSSFTAITNNTQYWVAITYDQSTSTCSIYVDGVLADDGVINLDTITWDKLYILGDGFSGGTAACSVAYCRAWNRILNSSELTAEAASITAVSMTSLIWDNPLQASIDLTAHNNTFNQLVGVGTVTTDTTDPLISVTAGPPTNTTPASAIEVTSDSVVFASTIVSGNPVNVWYKYTPPNGTKVSSMLAMITPGSTTSNPKLNVADSLTNANIPIFAIGSGNNKGLQTGVDTALTYYIRVDSSASGSPNVIQFSILEGLDLEVPGGSYAINDDTKPLDNFPLPLVFLDNATGFPINFIIPFPTGEGGSVLPDGKLLVTNESAQNGDGDGVTSLYDDSGETFVTSIDLLPYDTHGSVRRCVASNGTSQYLVAYEIDNDTTRLVFVSNACVEGIHFDLSTPSVFLTALGMLPNSAKAYLALTDSENRPIKCVDLSSGAFLTDLNAGVANYGAGNDILCLDTNIILVPYWRTTGTDSVIVRKYNATGTVLATHNFDAYVNDSVDIINVRLCRWFEDDDRYVIWIKGPHQGQDIVLRVNVATGTVEAQTEVLQQYEQYEYIGAASSTPQRFGHSESCPIWVVQEGIIPPGTPGAGIYILTGTSPDNPRVDHDQNWVDASIGMTVDVAIPNPFAETYLAGDE